jgi:hypothetical protein
MEVEEDKNKVWEQLKVERKIKKNKIGEALNMRK